MESKPCGRTIACRAAGARFIRTCDQRAELVIRKGFRREIDSYSAFYENDGVRRPGWRAICATWPAADLPGRP